MNTEGSLVRAIREIEQSTLPLFSGAMNQERQDRWLEMRASSRRRLQQ